MLGRILGDRSQNHTCDQNAQIYLTFHEGGEWRYKKKSPWFLFKQKEKPTPQDVRELANYTNERMNRVAGMMDILLKLHDDWAITAHQDYIKMETVTLEYDIIIKALLDAGYHEDDYILQTEYTRKWGML